MSAQQPRVWIAVTLVCAAGLAATAMFWARRSARTDTPPPAPVSREEQIRLAIFDAIQPITLANCRLQRFGEEHDGGYLLCANLLDAVESGYSYGISGYDQWGCDVATRLDVRVHQYDCFDRRQPVCSTGRTVFHAECIDSSPRVEGGRPFETLESQIAKNGDAGKRLVVKMDVEGAEWESLLGAPEDLLQRIDQMAIEFHGVDEKERFLLAIWKLREYFYVVNLHWNNHACGSRAPFPAWAYEVLLVNKRIGVPDPATPATPSPLNRPNNPDAPDCQAAPAQ